MLECSGLANKGMSRAEFMALSPILNKTVSERRVNVRLPSSACCPSIEECSLLQSSVFLLPVKKSGAPSALDSVLDPFPSCISTMPSELLLDVYVAVQVPTVLQCIKGRGAGCVLLALQAVQRRCRCYFHAVLLSLPGTSILIEQMYAPCAFKATFHHVLMFRSFSSVEW